MAPPKVTNPRPLNVGDSLDDIQGTNKKVRGQGLDDLIELFRKASTVADLTPLCDKLYHKIFETLFRCSIEEKRVYLSKSATAQSTARFKKCGEALRVVVEHGAPKLKRKTVLALIDHITQVVCSPDGKFLEPILQGYIKALAAVLSHPTTVETLATYKAEGWRSCVDFIVGAIEQYTQRSDRESTPSRISPAPGASNNRSTGASSARQSGSSNRIEKTHLQDLLQALLSLVSAPNAPLLTCFQGVSSALVQVLQLRLALGKVQQCAFAILNTMLASAQTEDVVLATTLSAELLPVLSHWWRARTSSQDDALLNSVQVEILKALFSSHLHLQSLIRLGDISILSDVQDLCDNLWAEYARRDERAQLQLDDLTYSAIPQHEHAFKVDLFSLRLYNVEAERRWALLHILALLESTLSREPRSASENRGPGDMDIEHTRKRRRINTGCTRLWRNLRALDHAVQLTGLQLVPFLASMVGMTISDLAETLSLLIGLSSHQNGRLAVWALVASASLASADEAHDGSLRPAWKQLWQIAARSVSIPSSCRASCILLHSILSTQVLPYHGLSDDIQSLVTTADVNGPSLLVDSSIMLMTTLLHLRNHEMPNASHATRGYVVRWLFLRWDPADPAFVSSCSVHVNALDIVNLVRAAYGLPTHVPSGKPQTICGTIGETWSLLQERADLVRYLLLLEDEKPSRRAVPDFVGQMVDASDSSAARKLVAELLYPKLETVETLCRSWCDGKSAQISAGKLQSVMCCLVVVASTLPDLVTISSRQCQTMESRTFRLLKDALDAAAAASASDTLYEAILQSVRPYIPCYADPNLDRLSRDLPHLFRLFSDLSKAFHQKAMQPRGTQADPMDIDDLFDSQQSFHPTEAKVIEINRQQSSVLDARSFHIDTVQRLHLLHVVHDDPTQIGAVPSAFLDQFLSATDEEFVLCRSLTKELFCPDLVIQPEDAARVIDKVGVLISRSAFSSCEVALTSCLDVIGGLVRTWADTKGDLAGVVGELYAFFVERALQHNLLSVKAQIALTRLLFNLTEVNELYPVLVGLPMTVDALLSLLLEGRVAIKFLVASHLPNVFCRFALKTHENFFVNVLRHLPSDAGAPEGIALRLLALGNLAQRWPTLLRRCVYHIFETPGNIAASSRHAAFCIAEISEVLGLQSPQELFDLFAPQLLYTWLENHDIGTIPFEIFGFPDLQALLKHGQAEATALVVMRGQDEALSKLAGSIGSTRAQLIQSCFAKVMAYSMAHDISLPNPSTRGEGRVRKELGKEVQVENIYVNFVDMVGLFVSLVDQEDPVEEMWDKEDEFSYAAHVMREIKGYGHSEAELPANQQPVFMAKYLTKQISLLCARTSYQVTALWTPALVVSVARRLFNMVHPALGPLHACSVLRRVRVLICLAGPQACKSYPLEMLLHAIRPLIVETECADDALGMTQYLLVRGCEVLSRSPSFMAGYALSVLASLRVFMESSQSSTTQESQFKATMSKTQQFHSWFTSFLDSYVVSALGHGNGDTLATFKVIIQSASRIRSSGNAERGSHEGSLLLAILRDQGSSEPLLDESSRNLALKMLCSDFGIPPSSRLDAVKSDEEAQELATAVWKTCQAQGHSDPYLVWAGRVVGRGFAASGSVDAALLEESGLSRYQETFGCDAGSERGLLGLLRSLTADSDCFTAGLAESALRTIVSEAQAHGDDSLLMACQTVLPAALYESSSWNPYQAPPSEARHVPPPRPQLVFAAESLAQARWVQELSTYLALSVPANIMLRAISAILSGVEGFAKKAFPYIVHLVLVAQSSQKQLAKQQLSAAMKDWLHWTSPAAKDNLSLLLNTLLFLRTQEMPGEKTVADRNRWLDVDLATAASAATRCGMHKTALLLVEIASGEGSRGSRRSSAVRSQDCSADLLLDIFEKIDDPDTYYGLSDASSLDTILARLEYERDGGLSLAFRGARYDSHLRRKDAAADDDSRSLVGTLSNLGLSGLAHSLLQDQQGLDGQSTSVDNTFDTARRLERWNLPAPTSTGEASVTLYRAYQGCRQAQSIEVARQAIYDGFSQTVQQLVHRDMDAPLLRRNLGVLAALSELDDVLNSSDATELEEVLTTFEHRSQWMKSGRYADVGHILSCRQTSLSVVGQNLGAVNAPQARLVEVKSMLLSSSIYRFHKATQESLNIATSMDHMVLPSRALGLTLDAAAKLEAANSLWDHGEMSSSIRMLQSIEQQCDLKSQSVLVQRSDVLAKLGHQVSVARLEKPDSIQKKYLHVALKELRGKVDGKDAAKVYHQFAMFCDEQLQSADGLEDLERLRHLRQGKSDEVSQLKGLMASARDGQARARYQSHLQKAKTWLDLDEKELARVEHSRSEFVRLSLENYLLSLCASDEYSNDALRFTALWLERSDQDFASAAVQPRLFNVPTRQFAPLMNQLTSRLLDQASSFQRLMTELLYGICVDHPYHGMYQIWSGSKTSTNKEDTAAVLRQKATTKLGKRLQQTERVASVWMAIDLTNRAYHSLAREHDGQRPKQGQKIAFRDSAAATSLVSAFARCLIPPPTMQVPLSADGDYSHLAHVSSVERSMTIAGGISAPKIITLVASNGQRFKQLVKGGNDDLRQDAIMEQVFSSVSDVLKRHRAAQQRNLGIRTYKVLPLTSTSGLIEFVPNTIPLHDYTVPAHERYHPSDMKGQTCRKEISSVQDKSNDVRLATFRRVTERFQPVLRYFFIEYFMGPDEWFAKRTAYTRTTAAISILGHVLGLGDRHGHNILLDCQTGEAVHIDLGVAFEMGRILPIPELVPFRLTRDIVDGMGITKTEGVFRRCCEFTLDALREETYSIMTILDVLRYDPLHSWSISPVRMAKLQDTRGDDVDEPDWTKKRKGVVNEPSEADRSLEVVRKKLSKTLSVTATVNDLINQATDERNLALLYSGWSAYM